MSVISRAGLEICKSPLNTSSAKYQYSFSKAERFPKQKTLGYCQNYYDLPDSKSKRFTKMGYGNRSDFTKFSKGYRPKYHDYSSDFDRAHPHGPCFTFASGRDKYGKVYTGTAKVFDKNVPGPGLYNYLKPFGSDGIKYSFRGRNDGSKKTPKDKKETKDETKNDSEKKKKEEYIPKVTIQINPMGKYPPSQISNIKNVPRMRFDKSKRSNYIANKNPGPDTYDKKQLLGKVYDSTKRSYVGITIGSKLPIKDSRSNYPGPGSYPLPSDFGQYLSKDADKYPTENVYPEKKPVFEEKAWRHNMKKIIKEKPAAAEAEADEYYADEEGGVSENKEDVYDTGNAEETKEETKQENNIPENKIKGGSGSIEDKAINANTRGAAGSGEYYDNEGQEDATKENDVTNDKQPSGVLGSGKGAKVDTNNAGEGGYQDNEENDDATKEKDVSKPYSDSGDNVNPKQNAKPTPSGAGAGEGAYQDDEGNEDASKEKEVPKPYPSSGANVNPEQNAKPTPNGAGEGAYQDYEENDDATKEKNFPKPESVNVNPEQNAKPTPGGTGEGAYQDNEEKDDTTKEKDVSKPYSKADIPQEQNTKPNPSGSGAGEGAYQDDEENDDATKEKNVPKPESGNVNPEQNAKPTPSGTGEGAYQDIEVKDDATKEKNVPKPENGSGTNVPQEQNTKPNPSGSGAGEGAYQDDDENDDATKEKEVPKLYSGSAANANPEQNNKPNPNGTGVGEGAYQDDEEKDDATKEKNVNKPESGSGANVHKENKPDQIGTLGGDAAYHDEEEENNELKEKEMAKSGETNKGDDNNDDGQEEVVMDEEDAEKEIKEEP